MAALPITNVTELQAIDGYAVDVEYYLANDIDASDTINWNAGLGFDPISPPSPFTAKINFDGRGHTIKDLYINRPTSNRVGLFGICSGSTVSDVFLENIYARGKFYVGGLVGQGGSTIMNCGVISGNIISVGGAGCNTGGLVGSAIGTVIKSYSKANILIETYGTYIGGFVGRSSALISDCYSTGNIIGYDTPVSTGGFVGGNLNPGTITNCYSIGKVTPAQGSSSFLNGFVGDNTTGTILASYWDTETSGYTKGVEPVADPPSGKTTAQMKQEATFAGWDFCRTWKIIEGVSYPTLRTGKKKQRVRKSS